MYLSHYLTLSVSEKVNPVLQFICTDHGGSNHGSIHIISIVSTFNLSLNPFIHRIRDSNHSNHSRCAYTPFIADKVCPNRAYVKNQINQTNNSKHSFRKTPFVTLIFLNDFEIISSQDILICNCFLAIKS